MKKILSLLYAVISYAIFFGSFLYAVGFVGNMVVPKSIDGTPEVPLTESIFINASLLLLFALQHSIMARPAFKRRWTKIVPEHLERSTYVLLASVCLSLMMWKWEPIGGTIWSTDNAIVVAVLHVLFFAGFGIVLISTFLINHFDLFGLRQAWLYAQAKPYTQLPFRTPMLYKAVRHPLYLGFIIAFWATPVMTAAHLLFAMLTTGYILTAIQFEEKDLTDGFGKTYAEYKRAVPMIFPYKKKVLKEPALEDAGPI